MERSKGVATVSVPRIETALDRNIQLMRDDLTEDGARPLTHFGGAG